MIILSVGVLFFLVMLWDSSPGLFWAVTGLFLGFWILLYNQ